MTYGQEKGRTAAAAAAVARRKARAGTPKSPDGSNDAWGTAWSRMAVSGRWSRAAVAYAISPAVAQAQANKVMCRARGQAKGASCAANRRMVTK